LKRYADFLNSPNRSASRSRSGRSSARLGISISVPAIPFEPEFEKRTIMDFEQPIRDVDAEIGVDPDSGEHRKPHGGF
jgi:hypothetical protein